MSKVIITAAVTGGVHTPTMSPYLPFTVDDIAAHSIDAAEAGAAVVHIHARNPKTGQPTSDLEIFGQIIEKIKSKSNVVICISTGGEAGMAIEQRAKVITEFKPELASFSMGSLNVAFHDLKNRYKDFKHSWEKELIEFSESWVFMNSFKDIKRLIEIFQEAGTKPELEIYDLGHLYNVKYFLDKDLLKPPIYLQFVMGALGGIGATPYDLNMLHMTAERLFGRGYKWSVLASGRNQFRQCTIGALLGSNVRVGLEDNLYLDKGELARSSAVQVKKIKRILEELGLEIASPGEARENLMLGKA